MTDIATLALKIDASQVTPAAAGLDKLTASGAKAEAQANKTTAATDRFANSTGKAAAEQRLLERGIDATGKEWEKASVALKRAAAAQEQVVRSSGHVVSSAGAQRAGMQQLSYQLGDVATMFSMGAKPMQIFASQGGQVLQAIQLMSGGAGGLAGFLAGPWGIAIMGAVTVLGSMAAAHFSAADASAEQKKAAEELAQAVTTLRESVERETRSTEANTTARMANAFAMRQQTEDALKLAEAELARREQSLKLNRDNFTNTAGAMYGGGFGSAYLAAKDDAAIAATRKEIERLRSQINDTNVSIRGLQGTIVSSTLDSFMSESAAATSKFNREQDRLNAQLRDGKIGLEQYARGLYSAKQTLATEEEAAKKSTGAHRTRRAALTEEEKAAKKAREEYERLVESSKAYLASLEDQANKFGKSAIEVQRMEYAAKAAEAPTSDLALAISKAGMALEDLQVGKAVRDFEAMIVALENENKLLGLVGPARDKAALALEKEGKMAEWAAQGLTDLEAKWQAYLNVKTEGIDKADAIEKQADAAKRLEEEARRANQQLEDMARLLDNLGGFGSVLGSILAVASGNYNAVASGPLGDVLAYVLNQPSGKTGLDKEGKEVARLIGDELRDVFGANGIFGQTLVQTLQAAGVGMAASNAILGNQGTEGQIGSAIGGVIGNAIGTAIAGPLGGMIGSAIVGTIGGLLGGLVSGPAKGSVSIVNGQVVAGRGSDEQMLSNATTAAGGIVDALNNVADALGGTLNMAAGSVSIGQRKGNWVVDYLGRGNTKGAGTANFGQDSEAAIAAAIEDLINDGVLEGLRASTMNILKAGNDFETQLQKALAFEEVLNAAEAASSPFASQLKALSTQFEQLTAIFAEANATAEEYASLQAYIAQQQQALIDQASASYRSTFYTDAQNATYAKQTISSTLTPLGYGSVDTVAEYTALVSATDALANPELYGALMDLADEFGVLKDAADSAAEAEKALAAQRSSIQIQILQAQGKDKEALAKQRAAELASADASLRPLMQQLYKAQDIATAKDALSQAYDRESSALQQIIDDADKAAESLTSFRDSLRESSGAADSVNARLAKLMAVGSLASAGDLTAMGQLPGVGQSYLEAAKSSAGSYTDYQRAVATVTRYTDQAIAAAVGQKTDAQRTLDAMTEQVGKLIDIEKATISVKDAIKDLTTVMGGGSTGTTRTPQDRRNAGDIMADMRDRLAEKLDRMNSRLERAETLHAASFNRLENIDRRWAKMTRDGVSLTIATDSDNPLATTVAA